MWGMNLSFLREKLQVSSSLLIVVHLTMDVVYNEIVSQPLLHLQCGFFSPYLTAIFKVFSQ